MTEDRNPEPGHPSPSPEPAEDIGLSAGEQPAAPWAEATKRAAETTSRLTPGHVLAKRYRVEKLLGSGGMADR